MAETSVHRRSSGDHLNGTEANPPPPPPTLSPRDLISALPDAMIHHIFSFLPLKDIVKTSALSKRWRSTWTTTTDLVFDGGEIEGRPCSTLDFTSLVDSVLSQCTSPKVKRFHVTDYDYDDADSPKVDLWLRFAVQRRVEDLCLFLSYETPDFYTLPGFLYCLSWLVRLEVSFSYISLDRTIRWPCLKVLWIEFAELSDDFLGRVFRASPVLESLDLINCWGVKNIIIDSTSVKKLWLSHTTYTTSCNVEKIWAPHLLSLDVSGAWDDHCVFRLDDVSSLEEAELIFDIQTGDKGMCCNLLKELFEKLRQVPTITIHGWCLEILSHLEMEGVPSPLSKCQNLRLNGPVGQWDLPGIAYLLRSSQCLETLVIRLTKLPLSKFELDEESKEHFNFDEEDFLCSRKGNFECLEKHLKRVEIIGFEADSFGSKHLLALIKLILGDALVLEKLIIKAKLPTQYVQKHLQPTILSKLLGVSKNVLSYQRASEKAEIIFNYPFE